MFFPGGRRAAVARGVVCRVICNTTRILHTRGPIRDLGGCPRTEQSADGWWIDDAAVAEAHPARMTSKETITEAAIFAAAFRFCSLAGWLLVNSISCILNGISTVVRGGRRFFLYLQYCTVVQICLTCAVIKKTRRTTCTRRDTQHGHKKSTHPRASQGSVLRC